MVLVIVASEMGESGLSYSNQSTITGGNEAGVDVVLIQPFLLYYVNHVVLIYANRYIFNIIFIRKGKRFVTRSTTAPRSLKGWDHNCKMVYSKNDYCKLRT